MHAPPSAVIRQSVGTAALVRSSCCAISAVTSAPGAFTWNGSASGSCGDVSIRAWSLSVGVGPSARPPLFQRAARHAETDAMSENTIARAARHAPGIWVTRSARLGARHVPPSTSRAFGSSVDGVPRNARASLSRTPNSGCTRRPWSGSHPHTGSRAASHPYWLLKQWSPRSCALRGAGEPGR